MTDDHELRDRLTALTRDMLLIPSTNRRPVERRRCFEFIGNHLEALPHINLRRYESKGYPSLVATADGDRQPDVLLCGHLDVIEHPNLDNYHSHVRDGRIYGPGAGDMKGALAIMLELFRDLQSASPGVSLGVAITSDEESGGDNGVRYLIDEVGLRCGTALIPDGGSLNELTVEEKGVLHARIRCAGHAAHAAYPWLGDNALWTLTDRLMALSRHFEQYLPRSTEADDHWFATCTPTILRTDNETVNRIPDAAEARIDVRFPPPHTVKGMLAEIARVLGPQCAITPMVCAEPTHLDPDELFCEITEQVTGRPVRRTRASGGSDGRFLRPFGIPVNLSRPTVGNLHAPDEWIDINSMVTYYKICGQYINRKLNQ